MVKGFLARRIYTSPDSWRRDAILLVDEEKGVLSITEFDGVEFPATTFVEGIILPFEPKFIGGISLASYLTMNFPSTGSSPEHYWSLTYPGIFSGKDLPADAAEWRVARLC